MGKITGGDMKQESLYNRKLKNLARHLRKNMTDAERLLWSKIRKKQIAGYQFYRQRPIGKYIVDFYCPAARLVIEVDGGQHYFRNSRIHDKERDKLLKHHSIKVLRFTNLQILNNIDSVLDEIYEALKTHSPLTPPSQREGGGLNKSPKRRDR